MSDQLADSYRYCEHVSRTRARNFYYSFLCLPPAKRRSLCAIYAFMRHADDISDGGGADPLTRMNRWRLALDEALAGRYGESRILPAFHDTVERHAVPAEYFHALIDGALMDLAPRRYETFADTYEYCYRVAGVVGLVCIHVFGFEDPRAKDLAEANGIAFQLTNILRDLREDARMDRVYLPQEDLRRFGYPEEDLREGIENEAFRRMMRFEVDRARAYYERAAALPAMIHPDSRPCLRAMRAIYGGILDRIVAMDYSVISRRARVPTWRKLLIAGSAWCQSRSVREKRLSSA
jgi:15-cis-phytoene synthase